MTVIYAIYVILRHFGTSFHVITRHLGHCNVTYVIRRLNTIAMGAGPQQAPLDRAGQQSQPWVGHKGHFGKAVRVDAQTLFSLQISCVSEHPGQAFPLYHFTKLVA